MKYINKTKNLLFLLMISVFSLYMAACNENSVEENQTDDEFIKEVINSGYSTQNGEDDQAGERIQVHSKHTIQ